VSAPGMYDREFRDRAVRMYRDRLAEAGESNLGTRRRVGALLDLNPRHAAQLGRGRRTGRRPAWPGLVPQHGLGGGPRAQAAGRRAGAGE
jgi:hypothetical protein